MKTYLWGSLAGALVLFGVSASSFPNHHATGSSNPVKATKLISPVPAFVLATAKRLATTMGDASPTAANYVVTTRQAANQLIGAHVKSNPPVFLVVLHGHFIDRNAYGPPGSSDPTGSMLVFTIDTVTHQVLDLGVTNYQPQLGKLSPVHPLPGI